tara:strand:+ start:295 stop:423 length:129 start_codon:yes stop_codon:yes gene_type:complete
LVVSGLAHFTFKAGNEAVYGDGGGYVFVALTDQVFTGHVSYG